MRTETFWGLSAAGWTAIYTLLTAGLLLVATVAALYAARQFRVARKQAAETTQAQTEASRPYVIVTVEPSRTSQHLFDFVVRNVGRRPALVVSIKLDPPPIRASETEGFEVAKMKMLKEPVAMIAPAQELRAFYDSHIERNGREDLPASHRVTLRYKDSSDHDYNESAELDLEAMKGAMFAEVKTVHNIAETLTNIQKTLESASVMNRQGVLDVEASVEPYAKRSERISRDQAAAAERHARLVRSLTPQAEVSPEPTPTANPHSPGGSVAHLYNLLARTGRSLCATLRPGAPRATAPKNQT